MTISRWDMMHVNPLSDNDTQNTSVWWGVVDPEHLLLPERWLETPRASKLLIAPPPICKTPSHSQNIFKHMTSLSLTVLLRDWVFQFYLRGEGAEALRS